MIARDDTQVVSLGAVRPVGLPRTCSDEELTDAVKAWLLGLPNKQVAQMLGVEEKTVLFWTQSEEWQRLSGLLIPTVEGEAKGGITRTLSITLTALEDRVMNGDSRISNEGEIIGKTPVKAKELAVIAKTLGDLKDSIGGKGPQGNIKLMDLMKSLERFASAKEIESE